MLITCCRNEFSFFLGGGGVFSWLKKLWVKEIWPYQRVTGSNCDANPLYIPVFLITEARSSNFKKINCSQSPIFSGGHLCFICTERPGVGVCSGPPLLRTGGHFACACVNPLNDNSVGASNLMAGNRKLARKVTVLLKAISLVL